LDKDAVEKTRFSQMVKIMVRGITFIWDKIHAAVGSETICLKTFYNKSAISISGFFDWRAGNIRFMITLFVGGNNFVQIDS
jgi:hypothetical protein